MTAPTPRVPGPDGSEPMEPGHGPAAGAPGHGEGGPGHGEGGPGHGEGWAGNSDGGPDQAGGARRSGLRDPAAAVRGLGAGTLAMEAIVLLLAIQPIRLFGGDLSGWGVGTVALLGVLAGALAGCMRRRWAWHAGTALQVLLLCAGFLHWSLTILGLIFGAVWAYATHVRRTLLS